MNYFKTLVCRCVTILIMLIFLQCTTDIAFAENKIRITFINPGVSDINDPTGSFWQSVSGFMKAAAEDLNMDLEVIYSERNHIKMKSQAKEVIERNTPPDYLVVVNEKLSADEIVKDADQHNVKVFVMLNTFLGEQEQLMGKPREKYKNYIGSLIPDNRYAGYQMAKVIIDKAVQTGLKSDDGKYHLIGITGDHVTQASIERVDGLNKAISEYPDVVLDQIFTGLWRKDNAMTQTQGAIKRYPKMKMIWAANDPMALGAVESTVSSGKKPGQDILIGGLNWDEPALEKIKDGSMVISMGGHFMTGGWALVLLYDYHHGKDFADEGLEIKQQIFGELKKENIEQFINQYSDRNWSKIDFTKFSKVLNPSVTQYNFSTQIVFGF